MSGALPHLKAGPATYTAAGLILGGQLVRPAVSGDGLPAGLSSLVNVGVLANTTDASATILGVAATDANTSQFSNLDANGYGPMSGVTLPGNWAGIGGSNSTEDQVLDASILGFSVAVYNNVDIRVNYSAAVSFGALLAANATAGVRAWVSGDGPSAIVGRCTQPGGVTAAGLGLAFIRV